MHNTQHSNSSIQKIYDANKNIELTSKDGKMMYLVTSGTVDYYAKAEHKGRTPLKSYPNGSVFGERNFFWGEDKGVYFTREKTSLFCISESNFNGLIGSNPRFAFEIMKKMCAPDAPAQPLKAVQPAAEAQPEPKPELDKTPTVLASEDLFPEGHQGYPCVYKPEYKQLVYEKSYTCPCCKQEFQSYKVFQSKLVSSKPMRYDLRNEYTDFQLEWYDILTCPHCLFSMFSEFFNMPRAMDRQLLNMRLEPLRAKVQLDFNAERDIDFVFASHYLALACAETMLDSNNLKMRLWSNLSWLYEDVRDAGMENYACRQAASFAEAVYEGTSMNPVREQVICLAVAGMLYRAGEMGPVRNWLFKAKTMKMGKKAYSDIADRLLDEMREG